MNPDQRLAAATRELERSARDAQTEYERAVRAVGNGRRLSRLI